MFFILFSAMTLPRRHREHEGNMEVSFVKFVHSFTDLRVPPCTPLLRGDFTGQYYYHIKVKPRPNPHKIIIL